ncbi:MAG: hypothetical protein IJ703_02175 [Eubacterium sp.]|nr:hypothetical protein [Eubacterium sp.]
MRKVMKDAFKYISAYIITAAVLVGLLVAVALIPRSSIRENMRRSAELLCRNDVFMRMPGGLEAGKIDRYADSILLGIAYSYDSEKPLESVMWSAYYNKEFTDENFNLLEAVKEGKEANRQYLRYWHGSNVIVRPLHLIFSLKGIYILNAVMLTVLAAFLFALLIREGAIAPAIGLAAGFAAASVWYVPYSLEYTWTFYITLIMSIVMVLRERRGRKTALVIPFMICGMITCFMDFLTTELLTLLVPLLIVIWFRWREPRNEDFGWKRIAAPAVGWGAGYVGMWLTKWILAAIVLGENVIPYVKENLEERINGNIGIGTWEYLKGSISRNIRMLLPWGFGGFGIFAALAGGFAIIYLCYVCKKKKVRLKPVLMYTAVACVPFVRYLVLHNHSFLHAFFTFRTLIATILATALIVGEMIDWRLFRHENKKKRRT